MSFDSPLYALFLAAVVLLNRVSPRRFRPLLLLFASLLFYACWSPPLTLVIAGVILLTFLCARAMEAAASPAGRRAALALAAAGCAGLLIWFKYFNFLGEAAFSLFGKSWTALPILLPVGCSFYTFQALSYVIDVYRGRLPAVRRLDRYALYIAFFPQLVAGPIERAEALLPQLEAAPDPAPRDTREGMKWLLSGFFRKLALADLAAPMVNRIFALPNPDGSAAALGAVLFGIQIYCDFSGYSAIARGSAMLLGIRLRRNFDRPYLSRTVRGFWRRWHMSLTAWFTDYVYIPLGGSRRGRGRQILAVLAVFLLSGLWHGANWTFVAWGLCHGLLCAGEILLNRREEDGGAFCKGAKWLLTYSLVTLCWLLFRAESLAQAGLLLGRLFSPWQWSLGLSQTGATWIQAACLALGLGQLPLLQRLEEGKASSILTYFLLAACIALAWFQRTAAGADSAFIYFQF